MNLVWVHPGTAHSLPHIVMSALSWASLASRADFDVLMISPWSVSYTHLTLPTKA